MNRRQRQNLQRQNTQRQVALYALPASEARLDDAHDETVGLAEPALGRFPALAEQYPGMVWTTDIDLCLTQVSGNALQFFPHVPQALGTPLAEFFAAFGTDAFGTDTEPLQAHGAALGGQAQGFSFSGGPWAFHGSVEPLFNGDGDICGTIALAVDITDVVEQDEQRRRHDLALCREQKEQSLRTLAQGLALNINNYLTSIMGFTTLAAMHLPDGSPGREYLRHVEAAAEGAAAVTRRLRTFAQRSRPSFASVDLVPLIRGLDARIRGCLSPAVQVRFDLADDLPVITGDPVLLQTLVLNLAFNASEAVGDAPGLIVLRAQPVRVTQGFLREMRVDDPLPDGPYVWLQVSDTGCGLSEDVRAHLFEPFYSTKFTGRGLGLSTVRGIVRDHGGTIAVSSKPKLGTTFHVLLPCQTQSTTEL